MTKNHRARRLALSANADSLTHYLFRYPAKFHPPVVRTLLKRYTDEDQWVLDPFCGSGTIAVEASVLGRHTVGTDIDPVAVAVARAKTRRYQMPRLRSSAGRLLGNLTRFHRSRNVYKQFMHNDLRDESYSEEASSVSHWIPAIPNMSHWFRRYVIIDLARIRRSIELVHIPETHRQLFRVVFGSIIRNASNADPVPVSGLEVTSWMKRRDEEGRLIDPFAMFQTAMESALDACENFTRKAKPGTQAVISQGDATVLNRHIRRTVDAVITSPPYHGAVDYYRRHKLEMFWLGHTRSRQDRLTLLQSYIGRPKVAQRHPFVSDGSLATTLAREWESRIRAVSTERANAFRHYMVAMDRLFRNLARCLHSGAPAVLVVGHSTWNATEIPTTSLFEESAGEFFNVDELYWYPVKNRYMSYARRNDADISREYVLVFRRT